MSEASNESIARIKDVTDEDRDVERRIGIETVDGIGRLETLLRLIHRELVLVRKKLEEPEVL